MVTFVDADTAAHAVFVVYAHGEVFHFQCVELTIVYAGFAADAHLFVDLSDVARRGEHWRAVIVSIDRATATFTTVADSVKTLEHGVLEKGVMDVATFVFGFDDLDGFVAGDVARTLGVMLTNEAGKGIADHETDIEGQTGILL